MAAKKQPKISKFQKSYLQTEGMRPFVPKDMLPLFDHLLKLAKNSHEHGHAKAAGQELLHARKIALKAGAPKPEPKATAQPKRYSLTRVKLSAGGYDPEGRYYGIGQPLYRVSDNETGAGKEFRARDLADARETMKQWILDGAKPSHGEMAR
jgi:hypothetical protein